MSQVTYEIIRKLFEIYPIILQIVLFLVLWNVFFRWEKGIWIVAGILAVMNICMGLWLEKPGVIRYTMSARKFTGEGGIMQVNSSNGSLQQRFFSGTGSIGGIHLPDFNDKYIFSKKKSGVSDKEYRKQIREQAYEDFEKGQFQNKSEGFNRLMKSYTSEVSPDRKGIITSGLKAISRNRQNVLKPIDFVATLLEGKVKYQKLPSGNSDYIEFYDKNGEMVATYSNNGWTMYTTNAEASRQTEMCMIYNEAWGNAKRGIPLASEETVNVDNMQSRPERTTLFSGYRAVLS